jgi:soluble lytic murein transglycosylase-like protein
MPTLKRSKYRCPTILMVSAKSLFFIFVTITAIFLASTSHASDYTEAPVVTDAEPHQDTIVPSAAAYIQYANKSVSSSDAFKFAQHIVDAASAFRLDVSILLALIKIESRFDPNAASKHGAIGFAQVIPRWHSEKIRESRKITGSTSMFDPKLNAYVGAWALSDYIGNSDNVDRGLLAYNGSQSDSTKSYARKVRAEARKIRDQFLSRSVLKL